MQEYNIYDKEDNQFIGTFKTLLELKQWVFKMFCDNDEESIKRDIKTFYSLKNANKKITLRYLEDWFDWYYKKEEINTHEQYLNEYGNIYNKKM